jgi:hypothetical protein
MVGYSLRELTDKFIEYTHEKIANGYTVDYDRSHDSTTVLTKDDSTIVLTSELSDTSLFKMRRYTVTLVTETNNMIKTHYWRYLELSRDYFVQWDQYDSVEHKTIKEVKYEPEKETSKAKVEKFDALKYIQMHLGKDWESDSDKVQKFKDAVNDLATKITDNKQGKFNQLDDYVKVKSSVNDTPRKLDNKKIHVTPNDSVDDIVNKIHASQNTSKKENPKKKDESDELEDDLVSLVRMIFNI